MTIVEYIKETNWHIYYDSHVFHNGLLNILGVPVYSAAPIDAPLWFLRDLIVVVICSPLIYNFIKYTRIYGILFLCIAYLTRIWIDIPGLSITVFFFFSLGAYFSIFQKNIISFSMKVNKIFAPLSVILFVLCVCFDGKKTVVGGNLLPIYITINLFVIFNLASMFIEKLKVTPNYSILLNSCFFVYASHTVYILSFVSVGLNTLLGGQNELIQIIRYLLIPLVTASICVIIYYILTKYFPKIALPFTGFR